MIEINSDFFDEEKSVNDETTLVQRLEGMSVTRNEFTKPFYTSKDIDYMVIESINYIRKLEAKLEEKKS